LSEVRLREWTVDDIEARIAGRDQDTTSFGPTGDQMRTRLHKEIERKPSLEDGGFVSLAVESDGQLVGDIQARAPKNGFPPGVCEIGITLFPDARGRGVGRHAVALFTERLFEDGMARVQASTSVDNGAMRRVLELVGYEFEGVLRAFGPTDDGREDYAMYAKVTDARRSPASSALSG
jgi:RimJ/RimL family protein N-acetyltransferase